MKRYSPYRALLLINAILICSAALGDSHTLRIVGVQLEITEAMYGSAESFRNRIDTEIQIAVADGRADIVIFPEYTSAFLALIPYAEEILQTDTLAEAYAGIQKRNPSAASIKQLFMEQAPGVRIIMDEIWGSLAKKYSLHVIAGTWFAKSADQLKNRMAIYGPSGDLIYNQDKVFLTDFELDVLNLTPGQLLSAKPVHINGYLVGTTICRDTFFPEWNERFSTVDVWIDIKANGVAFTAEESQKFLDALPARIAQSGVPMGVTVCLTGSFLDLFWEGRSFSVFSASSEDFEQVAQTYNGGSQIYAIYSSDGTR